MSRGVWKLLAACAIILILALVCTLSRANTLCMWIYTPLPLLSHWVVNAIQ